MFALNICFLLKSAQVQFRRANAKMGNEDAAGPNITTQRDTFGHYLKEWHTH